jgi:hypothetical protein
MKKYLSIAMLTGALLMSGCGGSNDFNEISGLQGNAIIVAPLCQDDAYTTNQDAALTVNAANGVLANDVPNGGTVTFQATSTQGGTITGDASGAFTYTPPNSFTGVDTFTYTVTNAAGQVSCRVTITVNAVNGFFVDAINGNDTTGSFQGGSPYQTIQAAVADAPTNADIIVTSGNYTGGINLKDGQRLLGSGSALVNPQGANRPQLTGPVVLADGNTLDFLRIANSPNDAIDGDNQVGGTITNCEIDTPTGDGIQIEPGTGTWTISNNTISDAGLAGVALTASGSGQLTYVISDNTISDSMFNGIGGTYGDTSSTAASITGNILSGNGTNATVELIVGDDANFCLDLENNTNDDVYAFFIPNTSTATISVEELNSLTAPQPGGAGNTGTVDDGTGIGGNPPTPVNDGFCGF